MNLFFTRTKQILQAIKRKTDNSNACELYGIHQNCKYKSARIHTFLPDPHLKLMDMDPDLNGILYSI
jgi:hypothetical protein